MNSSPVISPYRSGAEHGLGFGLYLSVLMVLVFSAAQVSILPALLMIMGVPVLIYRAQRGMYLAQHGCSTLSALWMQGIMMFVCGSLLMVVVVTVWLRWVMPDLIFEGVKSASEFYASSEWEHGKEMAEVLERMLSARMLPSAYEIAAEMMWLTIFSGSMLSLLMALLAQARGIGPATAVRKKDNQL